MGRMVPMGFELHFSPAELAVLWTILIALALALATPAALPLAMVGAARGGFWNGAWYWALGNAVTIGLGVWLIGLGWQWVAIPVSWIPGILVAWLLRVRRPRGELGWEESRRAVGEQ